MTYEKNVPIPPKGNIKRKHQWVYDMEAGDSIYRDEFPTNMRSNLGNIGKRLGRKYSYRNEGNGVRVWRVE